MNIQILHARWTRAVFSLIVCVVVDWILWKHVSEAPNVVHGSWIEAIISWPGTVVALLLVGAHGSESGFWTVYLAVTAIVIFAVTYCLLILVSKFIVRNP